MRPKCGLRLAPLPTERAVARACVAIAIVGVPGLKYRCDGGGSGDRLYYVGGPRLRAPRAFVGTEPSSICKAWNDCNDWNNWNIRTHRNYRIELWREGEAADGSRTVSAGGWYGVLSAECWMLSTTYQFCESSSCFPLSLDHRCSRARNAKPRARIPPPAIRSPERKVQCIDALTRSRAPGQPRSPRSRRGQVAHRHHHITDPPVTPARFTKPQSSKSKSKTSAACGSSTCDFVRVAGECPESPFFFLSRLRLRLRLRVQRRVQGAATSSGFVVSQIFTV